MAGRGEFADVQRSKPRMEKDPKKLTEISSSTIFESREHKGTSEKYRSHQTLSFKRNLLDLEFNAAHGDTGAKKSTQDLADIFERKSSVGSAHNSGYSTAGTPRKDEKGLLELKDEKSRNKSKLAIILNEIKGDKAESVDVEDSFAEDSIKIDEFSFEYESAESTTGKAEEPSMEIDDKFSENYDSRSETADMEDYVHETTEFVDIDCIEAITEKRESISDKIDIDQSLLIDNISTEGDAITQQDIDSFDIDVSEEDSIYHRIRVLKQSMDEINSQIALEKDFLRQEKLELENSRTLVPVTRDGETGRLRVNFHDPKKVFEDTKIKERRLKMSFQMKQLAEAQKKCNSEMQMISSTACQVEQLNLDMADYSFEELTYLTVQDNNYSITHRQSRSPCSSAISSTRLAKSADRKMPAMVTTCPSDLSAAHFDASLISPIEFTLEDTRLQMQAADHFKLKISQLEAQLNSSNFQPPKKIFPGRSSDISLASGCKSTPMKALTS